MAGLSTGYSQDYLRMNLPDYDDKWLHYGFSLGGHGSRLGLQYNDLYISENFDSVHSVTPRSSAGFSLGFILNLRLGRYTDLRLLPTVSFYEYKLAYRFIDPNPEDAIPKQEDITEVLEATLLEFPLLLKYKSMRFKNSRAYLIGGLSVAVQVTSQNRRETDGDQLVLDNNNIFVEYGFGIDFYFEYFKFSPELRFSHGLLDQQVGGRNSPFNEVIDRLLVHKVALYLMFE